MKIKNELKLENFFKGFGQVVRHLRTNRFLLYKTLTALFVIAIVTTAGYFAYSYWQGEASAQAAWYNDSWTRRAKLTIDPTKVSGDLTDFPVLISTTSPELATYAKSDGSDIVFTDVNGTKLEREIESYTSATGVLVAWVKVPAVADLTDTVLYMYFGNSAASEPNNASAVWDSNYRGVWHMPHSTTASTTDSTVNGNNGYAYGNASTTASGKMGGGFAFDGAGDYLNMGNSSSINITGPITVSAWVKTPATGAFEPIVVKNEGTSAGWQIYRRNDDASVSGRVYVDGFGDNATTQGGFTVDVWQYVALVVNDGGKLSVYVNTGVNVTGEHPGALTLTSQPLYMGNTTTAGQSWFNGSLDEVRISATARSAAWIATEYNNQNDPTTFYSWTTTEAGGGPVAYWNFDEGYASTTYDRIGNNDGTLQSNTAWVEGKYGKALSFDGTDDRVLVANNASLQFQNVITFLAWVKTSEPERQTIFDKYASGGYGPLVYIAADGSINFTTYDTTTSRDFTGVSTGFQVNDGQWHLVAVTADRTTGSIVFYKDNATSAVTDPTPGDQWGTSASVYIGYRNKAGQESPFQGLIDDVKIYNRALSASDIAAEYNSGGSVSVGTQQGNHYGDPGIVTDGLVGYWKFDETTAWGATAGAVKDFSGLNNHGTSTNATTTTDQAKYGRSAGVDGNGDYVTVADNASLDVSTTGSGSAWVYLRAYSLNGTIATKGSADWAYFSEINSSGKFQVYLSGATPAGYHASNATIALATWTHVSWTYDGSKLRLYINGVLDNTISVSGAITNSSGGLCIGTICNGDGNYSFNGYLDDVKIFNKALTGDEVMREYVSGPGPVGYWRFEEKTGTTAYDESGNGKNGTLTNSIVYDVGKFGGGVRSNNTTTDYVSIPDMAFLGSNTVGIWFKANSFAACELFGSTATSNSDGEYAIYWSAASNITFNRWVNAAGDRPYKQAVYATSNLQTGRWYYLTGAYDTGTGYVSLYTDGVLRNTSNTVTTSSDVTGQQIGGPNASYPCDGFIDDVKIYNYARSSRQIALDYNGGGPVGYWSFDEGYASTTKDTSGQGNHGTLVDTTAWTMNGKFGKAVSLDGGDYIQVTDSDSLTPAGQEMTVTAWVNIGDLSRGEYLLYKGSTTSNREYAFALGSDEKASFSVYHNGSSATVYSVAANRALVQNRWEFVAASWEGATSRLKIYYNGALDNTASASATVGNYGSHLYIGTYGGSTATYGLHGYIDDLKIYNYARTPEEIRQDYNSGGGGEGKAAAVKVGGQRNAASTWDDGGFGGAAPVAYWTFDEKTGTTAYDSTGNLNNGTLTGGPTWKFGKVGSALQFDGTDDYVSVDASVARFASLTAGSISAWFNTSQSGSTMRIFSASDTADASSDLTLYQRPSSGDQITLLVREGGVNSLLVSTDDSYNDGQWHHVVATVGSAGNALYIDGRTAAVTYTTGNASTQAFFSAVTDLDTVRIGNNQDSAGNEQFWNGFLDDVKIYDYARSQAQIAWDYNGGQPVAHWMFDDASGGTAIDASGNGNSGTLYPGTGGTVTATSSMWVANGKINTALSFDGTDDYVYIGTGPSSYFKSEISLSAWAYVSSNATGEDGFIHAGGNGDLTSGFYSRIKSDNSNNAPTFVLGNGSSRDIQAFTTKTPLGRWFHLALVTDGTTKKFYLDGALKETKTLTAAGPFTPAVSEEVVIGWGYDNSEATDGQLDDVRIYNYARTAEQVRVDYNGGGSIRF